MTIAFYIAAVVAVAATFRVITCTHAVHALLYLIVSLLSVAIVFYVLGAPFAAALEVIVYAGAIMVLFVFVIMMLNITTDYIERERQWLSPRTWLGPALLALILLSDVAIALSQGNSLAAIDGTPLSARNVGMAMFGPYVLAVELAAFILLAALVIAAHLGRQDREVDQMVADRRQRRGR